MTDALAQTLLNAIPITIGAIATAYVTIKSANRKTEESAKQTNAIVGAKLDEVHETVNGNYSALQAKHAALASENQRLRDQLAQRSP